jgi:hypothetical protein
MKYLLYYIEIESISISKLSLHQLTILHYKLKLLTLFNRVTLVVRPFEAKLNVSCVPCHIDKTVRLLLS